MGSKGQSGISHQMNWCVILKSRRVNFDAAIDERFGDLFTLPTKHGGALNKVVLLNCLLMKKLRRFLKLTDADGNSLHSSSAADILVNAEVLLPQGEEIRLCKSHKEKLGL